ncbi:MAG: D-alanyl-D-alanine carboxypeptidase [Defluviitaleaceae bacterium]|nr:D-alanyl-D-alanine carboxypeptidase [Defluviitaleaceae bacterium]MCL2238536.1 D-alanyl-D-alanine carboxypeptidase [Defluviitaleaceae bacterium]
MRRIFLGVFALLICLLLTGATIPPLPLQTEAAILVEQTTGRVLYERNMHRRMYPASMTKLLTALVVLEHLDPDDVIVVGPEIRNMPLGYATGVHQEGEHITVRMLLKSLLIRSGNEAARVLALHTIQVRNNRLNLNYMEDAKGPFSNLLNDKARELGALDTRFTNPYGLHDTRHFTTAYDLARVSRAFMDVPLLAEIVGIRLFSGDGLEGRYPGGAMVQQFNWTNTNQMLPDAPHGHPFVTGMRTGYTTPAGECFAASAYHNGLGLISIVFDSASPGRWQDTRRLLDFGFNNFAFRDIAAGEARSHTVPLYNPRLEDDGVLTVVSQGTYTVLLSHEEFASIERIVTYGPAFLMEEDGETRILIPEGGFETGDIVGTVAYKINGETIFTTNLYTAHAVLERTFDNDMDFFIARYLGAIFSRAALPYWFGSLGILFGILGMSIAIVVSRRARNYHRWRSTPRGKFYY